MNRIGLLFLILSTCLLNVSIALAAYPNYTICTSGCDYNNLQGAANDLAMNHATLASPVTITISGVWASPDTTRVSFSGITTSITNTITVTATGSARFPGTYSTSAYRLYDTTNDGGPTLFVGVNYFTITGIQIYDNATGTDFGTHCLSLLDGNNFLADSLLMLSNNGTPVRIKDDTGGNPNISLINSVSISYASAADSIDILNEANTTTWFLLNDVAISAGSGVAFNISGGINIKNTYGSSSSGSAYTYSGGTNTIVTVASSDTTGTSGLQNVSYSTSSGAFFTNITPLSENLSLLVGSSLILAGTNLSGTFTDDIIGNTRQPSGPWDIGVFKYTSAIHASMKGATLKNATNF